MKRLILLTIAVFIVAFFLLATMPAAPVSADWPGAPCGAVGGEPPGWSQVSKGEGGSPGIGPGAP